VSSAVYKASAGVIVARIFISYATPDRAIAEEVSGWLRAAGHEPFLGHDLRNGISVGEGWKQRLYRETCEGAKPRRFRPLAVGWKARA
jgi:hypothetical protein